MAIACRCFSGMVKRGLEEDKVEVFEGTCCSGGLAELLDVARAFLRAFNRSIAIRFFSAICSALQDIFRGRK